MTPDTSPKTFAEATLDALIGRYVERVVAQSLDTGAEFKVEIREKLDQIDGQIQQIHSSLHDVINRVRVLEESASSTNAVTSDEFANLKDAVKQGLESTLKSLGN